MAQNTVTKIGKYDVVDVLGKGGMGIVYKAMDNRIGRLVAIKMMTGGFADNPDLLKRFYREAQSTGMLQHPNIVIVYDLGDQDGNPYLVMEFLDGEPLDKMIANRRELSMVEKLGFIIQACNGLNYAHQRGIVHRDIKPGNLMVLKDGSVKLVDFGIARLGDNSLTRTGQVVGTIHYMSPEQINAQVVDGRTDIWSAGVMLYELLTYALPFEGKDTASTLLKIIHEPPPPLKSYLSQYPPDLEEVIQRALSKDREERYATAEDFAFDLSRVQEQIKKHMVSEYVDRARASMERADLGKAKEILQQVLRVDTAHTIAKELMHEVQQRLQRQQRSEQIKQLRSHAEDAFAQKLYDDALAYAEQALSLDKTNTELLNLRDLVKEAKERKDKLDKAIRKAEAAQSAGDLEAALKAAEEALAVDSDNTQARAVHAAVSKELADHARQRQIQGFLDEARRDISSRKFTAAFEVLKQAEELDPSSPEVHALMNLASSGREQEARRRELERFTNEIEDALNRDDYAAASQRADEALHNYPSDPGLLKLKALTDKQREVGERKRFVEEQMAVARKLLDGGKAAEALAALEKASQRVPGDARLQSLLAIVRESAERDKADKLRNEYIARAKDCLRKKDYPGAVKVLESAQAQIEASVEINDLLQFAREEAASQSRRRKVESAAEEAQRLMAEQDYEHAVSVLEAALRESPDEELKVVLAEAKRHVDELNRKIETAVGRAQRLVEQRKFDDAVSLLEAQPKAFAKSVEFCNLLERARDEADQARAVGRAIEQAKAAVEKNDFAAAFTIVEACRKSYGETPEVKSFLAELESKKTSMAKAAVEKAVRDARTLLLARQYGAALNSLNAVTPLVSAAPPELQKQHETLKKDATAGASRVQKEADLGKTIVAGSMESQQTMVAGSYEAVAAPPPARPGVAPAPAPAAPRARVASPAPAPRKSPVLLIAIVAVLAIAGVVGYVVLRPSGPPPATTFVEINGIPWGTVKTVTSSDGKVNLDVNQETPVRVMLPPGEYKIVIAGPSGEEKSESVTVSNDAPGQVTPVFEQIDVEKIVNASN